METKLMLTEEQITHCKEKGFNILKSGQFKGWLSSKWFRNNSGRIILTCPICGGIIGAAVPYRGQKPCNHAWSRDPAGFRYRWLHQVVG